MQRWWYLDSHCSKNALDAQRTPSQLSARSAATGGGSAAGESLQASERAWTFAVHLSQPLLSPFEALAVTGDCAVLGDWDPQQAVLLTRKQSEEGELKWTR